ncbi:MAG: PEP-CTERM sorting domain-containing protein [Phycisphaerae bacterium]|nr:PEP-CTERM sorting domain-containing protein [Phycisphaerae bacterium]NIP32385.1 PEP-CTERM sorting domain-containing protein [Candidatus Saccharibacteria bacterium]NIS49545.1 PEP-CTERM sorting domain-containing protein [Phycisphaerae bacterium]NIU54872.1 PEP-CTERM sorting domain-containing protein [Phycisphaerae bacterium]NIV00586.1 PEP-CTERM sorting domain-containing protein [Phycisphaerae bacterium]
MSKYTILHVCAMLLAVWPCCARATWDFSYGYDTVFSANAEDYTLSMVNVFKHDEGLAKFYQPNPENLDEAFITMRFDFPQAISEAHLTACIATYRWWFGRGWGSLYGSKDGSNWEYLIFAQSPEQEGGLYWKYDNILPASLLGGTELWFKVLLDCTNTSGTTQPWARATAQFGRGEAGDGIDAFRLNVNYVPEPTAILLLGLPALALLRKRRS